MDAVVPSIFLSSFAGALLFFAGGRLSLRPAPAAPEDAARGPAPVPPAPIAAEEMDADRAARALAEEQAAGARRARDEAAAALEGERARSAALREELSGERDARARADAEAARERKRLIEDAKRLEAQAAEAAAAHARAGAQLAGAQAETKKTQAELDRARAELSGAKAELGKTRGELTRAIRELAAAQGGLAATQAALAAAQGEIEKARAELSNGRSGAPDLTELQRRNVEVTMKLRALEQRAADAVRKEAENAELRRRVDALAAAAAEADELRDRVRDLEAQGYARRAPEHLYHAGEGPVSEGKPALEASLALGLRDLCQAEPGCRAVVLSDTRGLLVAAYGDPAHREELAAAASLTSSTAARLRELLPLGEVASVLVVDDNQLVLRTRWLRWEEECFHVSTLGAAAPGDDAAGEALRAQLAALIGAS